MTDAMQQRIDALEHELETRLLEEAEKRADLLAACEAALPHVERAGNEDVAELLVAAIAKAKGDTK